MSPSASVSSRSSATPSSREADRYWSDASLVVTITSAGGERRVVVDKPFAVLGSHTRADVHFPEGVAPKRALYLHACRDGIYYVYLEAAPPPGRPSEGWLLAGGSLTIGGVRVSASGLDDLQPNPTASRLTQYGSTPPPFPVVRFMRDERSLGNRRYRSRLSLIGKRVKSPQGGQSPVLSTFQNAVFWEDERLWIIDLLSSRGTQVDGVSVDAAALAVGQVADLGNLQLVFRRLSSGQSSDDSLEASDSGEIHVDFQEGPSVSDLAADDSNVQSPAVEEWRADETPAAPEQTPDDGSLRDVEERYDRLHAELEQQRDELAHEKGVFALEREEQRQNSEEFTREAASQRQVHEELAQQREKLKLEREQFLRQTQVLAQARADLERQREQLQQDRIEAERRGAAAEQARAEQERLVAELKQDAERSLREQETLARNREALAVQHEQLERNRTELTQQRDELAAERRLVECERETATHALNLSARSQAEQAEIETQQAEILTHRREIEVQQKNIEAQRLELATAQSEHEALKSDLTAQQIAWGEKMREWTLEQSEARNEIRVSLAVLRERIAAAAADEEARRQESAVLHAALTREKSELESRRRELEASAAGERAELAAKNSQAQELLAEHCARETEFLARECELTRRATLSSEEESQAAAWHRERQEWAREREQSREREDALLALHIETSERYEQLELEQASLLEQQRQLEAQLEMQLSVHADERLRLESFAAELDQRERAMFEREMGFEQAKDERRLMAAMYADEQTAVAERATAPSHVAQAQAPSTVTAPEISQTVDWAGEKTVDGAVSRERRLPKPAEEFGCADAAIQPRESTSSQPVAVVTPASLAGSQWEDSAAGPALGRRARADRDQMGAIVTDRLILREATGRYWLRGLWVVAGAALLLAALAVGYILSAAR